MAVPTISSVSPATGLAAGGNVAVLEGTNFRQPTEVIAVPMTNWLPTVKVTVGGLASPRAEVWDATHVRFIAPRYTSPTGIDDVYNPLDVMVYNLDSSGLPITGEVATATAAYTYRKAILGAADAGTGRWIGYANRDPPLLVVLQYLIDGLRREVTKFAQVATHVDFGDEGTGVMIAKADLPNIGIHVDAPRDPDYSEDDPGHTYVVVDGQTWDFVGRRTHMLVCDLTLSGSGWREAMHLCQAVEDFCMIHPSIAAPADQLMFPGEDNSYPVEITRDPSQASAANDLGIVAFMMQVTVRGIPVMPDEPVRFIDIISQFMLTTCDMTGADVEDRAF